MDHDFENTVILDANIIRKTPMLTSREWESFASNAAKWDALVAIPEVVFMEAVNCVIRDCKDMQNKITGLGMGTIGLQGTAAFASESIQGFIDGYEERLRVRLADLGICIIPMSSFDHMEVARRASLRRAPYQRSEGNNPKDGYRDTLIWLTVIECAKNRPSGKVWFVSNNYSDFGPRRSKGAQEPSPSSQICPLPFGRELEDELEEAGLEGRVHYVADLAVIEQHFASQLEPIESDELSKISQLVEKDRLDDVLRSAVIGTPIGHAFDMPDGAKLGIVKGIIRSYHYSFSEGARRANKGWTAYFSILVVADVISMAGWPSSEPEWKPARHTMNLRVRGVATIDANSIPEKLVVTAVGKSLRVGAAEIIEMAGESLEAALVIASLVKENSEFFDLSGLDSLEFIERLADLHSGKGD